VAAAERIASYDNAATPGPAEALRLVNGLRSNNRPANNLRD
jgi:hypothetical protein